MSAEALTHPAGLAAALRLHYDRRFGAADDVSHRFFPGVACGLDVMRYPPGERREIYTYAGVHAHPDMVVARAHGAPHVEQFFAVSRTVADVLADLVGVCATHACGQGQRLDEWSVVPLPEIVPGSLGMRALTVAPAVFEGDGFGYMQHAGVHVRFLWVIPIFQSEAAAARRAGALEALLFRKGVDLADLHREPVHDAMGQQ